MAQNVVRKLIDSGIHFTEDSQAKAEKLVKGLVKSGELRRKDAEHTLQTLIARGKETSDRILSLVQAEVAKQMSRFTDRVDVVEDRIEDLAGRMRATTKDAAKKAAAPVKKAAAPVKKAAAPVKKAAAPVKKAAAPVKKAGPAKRAATS